MDDYIHGKDISIKIVMLKDFSKELGYILDKYKTPFLPKGEDAQKEISEYESECRKQYPEIDAEKIKGVFSTVCWLANR